MAVYGSSIAIGFVILPCVVFWIRRSTAFDTKAPYIAAALMTGFNAIYNFLGHKKFSFRAASRDEIATPCSLLAVKMNPRTL
jgi:hypothetical protein